MKILISTIVRLNVMKVSVPKNLFVVLRILVAFYTQYIVTGIRDKFVVQEDSNIYYNKAFIRFKLDQHVSEN